MSKLAHLHALEILDSRGNPTLQVTAVSSAGTLAVASVPSGASTGIHEAKELRDNDPKRYLGKGVLQAVANVHGPILHHLKGQSIFEQEAIDRALITLDGTPDKSRLGANALLGVSLAILKCAALEKNLPLYRYVGDHTELPCPMMNLINGGVHADSGLDFQEFMIRPIGAPSIKEAIRWGSEIFHTLKKLLAQEHLSTAVGDEGGFAPSLSSHEEALDLLMLAIQKGGFTPGKEVSLAIDCAASEFFEEGCYIEKKKKEEANARNSIEQIAYLKGLTEKYPIDSIEDGLDQADWEGWALLTKELGDKLFIVGDDLFVTNPLFIQKGIDEKVANAVLIKPNQIGTFSETKAAIALAKKNNYRTVISHRSGETEDTTIADLAVGLGLKHIKTGSLSRSERTAKYNRLLAIEEELAR